MLRIWIQLLVGFSLVSFARAESPKALWVIQEPAVIAVYELPSFAHKRTLKIPRRVLEHPEYLRINNRGQMLFHPLHGEQWASGEMATAGHLAWFWNGQKAREWKLPWTRKTGSSGGKEILNEIRSQTSLSADGQSLFWFENQFEKVMGESGAERSVHTGFRVWRTDIEGNNPVDIIHSSIPGSCECGTGICSETCPEFSFWAPLGVVSDFFLVTRFTPGQIGSTYYESYLYQDSGREWVGKKLGRVAENPLDASEKGELLVTAVPDKGCCGWQNDSNDQTLLLRRGGVSVIYDEFSRFGNRNYDLSFYTAEARLAQGNERLAYTLASTATPGNEIRLSLDGKINPEELSRIRKALDDLPAVEVWKLEPKPQLEKTIPRAGLVGWINKAEILIAQDGHLAVFNVRDGAKRPTPIRVRGAADALVR